MKVYKNANQGEKDIKVILFFSLEEKRVLDILRDLEIEAAENIILINADNSNEISASNVRF